MIDASPEPGPCPICGPVRDRRDLSMQQWVRFVAVLREGIGDGSWVLEHADVPMVSVTAQQPVPPGAPDVTMFRVHCARCGRGAELSVDHYHGKASWRPDDERLATAPDAPEGREVVAVPQRSSITGPPRGWRERLRSALDVLPSRLGR